MLRTEGRKSAPIRVGLTMRLGGSAANISGGGFCLMVDHHLSLGADVDLIFQLPGSDKPIKCQGQVIWCAKSQVVPDNWDLGVKFVNLLAEQQEEINDFVRKEIAAATAWLFDNKVLL